MKRAAFVWALLLAALFTSVSAQQQLQSGRNVNASGGPATLDEFGVPILGDPYLQRQNEPSVGCSVRNPLNCLLGANDYRTVDYPDPAGGKVTGDAWLGVFWTRDGGQTWRSHLLPGFPQDTSTLGATMPMKGFQAAADPTVRPGSNGLLYYSGIAFNRSAISGNSSGAEGKEGVLFLATYIDDNNTQQIDTPFRLVRVTPIAYSTPDKFTDKPWLAVDIPRAGSATCTIPAGNGVPAQSFPSGNVYVAYTVFQGDGDSIHSKLMFARSTDCGQTWGHPIKLSESFKINQSASIAIHPVSGQVLVAWREFSSSSNKDGIVVARSDDFGKTFPKAVRVVDLTLPTAASAGLDQPSLPAPEEPNFRMFRTNSYPSMCVASNGMVYLAWSQRNVHSSGDARVLYSTTVDGDVWSTPTPIDNPAARGHQAMPALACGANKVTAIWYDQREDALGWLFSNGTGWGPFMADPIPAPPSRTIDVRAAEAVAGLSFGPSIRVSRYQYGLYVGDEGPAALQLEYNLENLPLFAGGRVPFLGDYIDVAAAPAMLPAGAGGALSGTTSSGLTFKNKHRANKAAELGAPNGWIFNTSPSAAPVFHAVWADNRDVRAPGAGFTFENPECNGNQAGTKNQNIYTAQLTPGVAAGALGNARPYGELDRAFPIYVRNTTDQQKSFQLTIATEMPPNVVASFSQFAVPDADPPIPYPLLTLLVNVAPHSAVARTVFVHTTVAGTSLVPIRVDVDEIVTAPAVGLQTSVVINPDPTNPAPADANVAQGFEEHTPVLTEAELAQYLNPDFFNPNFFNPNFFNPNFFNPNFINPNFINPNFINPNFINPNFINPNFFNPNFFNPNFFNPNFINPNFFNPNFINPNFINPNFFNQPVVTELNWTVEAGGNTASSFLFRYLTANPLPPEWTVQLLIYRLYHMPAPAGENPCNLETVTVQEKLLDVQNPNFINPNFINPNFINFANPNFFNAAFSADTGNATFALGAGDAAQITLRIAHDGTFQPETVSALVIPEAVDSVDAANGSTTPDFVPTLTIVNTPAPDGTVGSPYSYQFTAIGGDASLTQTWSVQSGLLPQGLTLSSSGLLSGTPGAGTAGTHNLLIKVTDGTQTALLTFTFTIYDPLSIATTALPSGVSGDPYSTTLGAAGGKTPYQWSQDGGTLPAGIALASDGQLTGTTVQFGLFTFTAKVVDSGDPARVATRQFTLAIGPRQAFVVQPTSTSYLEPIAPAVQVRLTDGNEAPVAGATVTLVLGTNPTEATLVGGTSAVTNASGVASFPNVRPSRAGTFTLVPRSFTVPGPASNTFSVTPLSNQIFDTVGDDEVLDILSATASTDGADLTLTIRYGAGFSATDSSSGIYLDTDQNITTGSPGVDSGGTMEEEAIGTDYAVFIFPNFDGATPTHAGIYRALAGVNNYTAVGDVPVTVLADGYRMAIPLAILGNDDGLLNFKLTSVRQISDSGFTGILDIATDPGVAPGTITPAGIVEQQSVVNVSNALWFLGGPSSQRVAQVITPQVSGSLTEIRTYLEVCTMSVEIQGVANGMPSGTVLRAAEIFPFSTIQATPPPFRKLVLSTPFAVTAGTPVALVFDAPVSCGIGKGPAANFYPRGSSFFRNPTMDTWGTFGTEDDLPFQVKITAISQ